jgi:nicotinamidase-related amidase
MNPLLTTQNTILLLVDYQPHMFTGVSSTDLTPKQIMLATKAMIEAASIMEIPIVMTSINESLNGATLKKLSAFVPKVIERIKPTFNAVEDPVVATILNGYSEEGRTNIIIGGMWTSICMSLTARALRNFGWNVYGLYDCCGDVTQMSHKYGLEAMTQTGVVPSTWTSVTFALLGGWDHEKALQIGKLFNANVKNP